MAIELLLVGNQGGTNVAQSLANAATASGLTYHFLDQRRAYSSNRIWQAMNWHLAGHRPALLAAFSAQVLEAARQLRQVLAEGRAQQQQFEFAATP